MRTSHKLQFHVSGSNRPHNMAVVSANDLSSDELLEMSEPKKIVIISDGTGKTARRLMDAVLSQYSHRNVEFTLENIHQKVRDKFAFDRILEKLDKDCLVIFSIIEEDLSRYFHEQLSAKGILNVNVLEPMLGTMSKFLGVHPDFEPGILQKIDDKYYEKIDAIGFTVEHDDGLGQYINEADIILLGPSRTCKTPISMYLACNFGRKVANIPILPNPASEQSLLEKLSPLRQEIIFGLTMQPEVLARVREERSQYLARPASLTEAVARYFDLHEVKRELAYSIDLFARMEWKTIDVTRRAIEEIAHEILEKRKYKF